MKKLKFNKLMLTNPDVYSEMTNDKGQLLIFVEHPYCGDEYPIIVIFPEFGAAACTDFFDTEDFFNGSDYTPVYDEATKKIICNYELTINL